MSPLGVSRSGHRRRPGYTGAPLMVLPMQAIDLLVAARWVIPVEPAGHVLEHHSIAIQGGRIEAVLPSDEAAARYDARSRIERPRHVVLPGFVNAHTHGAATLMRGLGGGLPLDRWLREVIWPIEQRWMGPEFVRDGTELAIAGMLTSGTTCFADMQLFPESAAAAAATLHMRACVGLPVVDAASSWAGTTDEYITKGLALHDEYRDDPLITTAFAPHAPYTVSDSTLTRIRRAADEIELPVFMHLHETASEIEQAVTRSGERPLARLDRLGLANPLLAAVHMTHADEGDVALLADRGVSVVHCPQSNLKFGSGVSPVVAMLARGINVALGTDGAASNNDLDMLDEMRTAALIAAGSSGNPAALGPHEVLRMATLNSAGVLGLADVTGSIVAGKWADLACIDLGGVHTQPVYDPATQIVYSASRQDVTDVWVAGRAAVTAGALGRIDTAELLARADRWRERIAATRRA
jgi:5-methylthioadenosine/S-adenosylhomocysteine deaminase